MILFDVGEMKSVISLIHVRYATTIAAVVCEKAVINMNHSQLASEA